MNFQFEEEQQQLADSLARVIDRDYAFESRKAIIASEKGHSETVWKAMAEMGITLLPMSEAAGGFGQGALALFPVLEQVGRGLLVEPLVETLMCTRLLDQLAAEQQGELLAAVAGGESYLAFAHLEQGGSYDSEGVQTTASKSGDNWSISGQKAMVMLADSADNFVVSARVGGDKVGLFLVDAKASGIAIRSMRTIDNHRAADVSFEGAAAVALGDADAGNAALEEALDFGTLLICAEAVGAMGYANETTLDYLKTRKQFGAPIGAFQALQHRMVDMTVSCEQSRSISFLACDAFDKAVAAGGADSVRERRHMVSAAKIKISDAARHVGQEAIQLHGGMGMTDEMKVSHAFKRLTMIVGAFGDADYHLGRFAATAE